MPAVQLKNLTPRHDTILAFIIANPKTKRGEVARIFGVTEAWLSTIIHSDIFQARLADRTDQLFCETLVPIKDKITTLAHKALDNLIKDVDTMPSDGHLRSAELALKMSGYGTNHNLGSGPITLNQTNVYGADASLLKKARERLGDSRPIPLPPSQLVIEGELG